MLELFPAGVEEERGRRRRRAGRLRRAAARARTSSRSAGRRRLGGRLARVSPARARGPAVGRAALVRARARSRSSIDPGRAFGTGAHGSTRAALELLQRLEPPARRSTSAAAPACSRSRPSGSASGPLAGVRHRSAGRRGDAENAARNGVEVAVARADVLDRPAAGRAALAGEPRAGPARAAARAARPAPAVLASGLLESPDAGRRGARVGGGRLGGGAGRARDPPHLPVLRRRRRAAGSPRSRPADRHHLSACCACAVGRYLRGRRRRPRAPGAGRGRRPGALEEVDGVPPPHP